MTEVLEVQLAFLEGFTIEQVSLLFPSMNLEDIKQCLIDLKEARKAWVSRKIDVEMEQLGVKQEEATPEQAPKVVDSGPKPTGFGKPL